MTTPWHANELERVSGCLVCDSEYLVPMYADLRSHGGWSGRLDRCRDCGTGHLNPRPTPASIGKAYLGDYAAYVHRTARPDPLGKRQRIRREIEDAYLGSRWGYAGLERSKALGALSLAMPSLRRGTDRLLRFAPAPPNGARLLDIGCATGSYMALMSELGWEVRGIELDAGAVETARGIGLTVRQGTMADVDPEIDGTFDHVTVGHVIEHVHNPLEALRATHRVLKPGGRLWIGTPNLGSVGSRLFRSSWRALEPPRHLVLFTPRSLMLALRRAGFKDVRLVRATASARWHLESSARLAGISRRRRLPMAAMAVNAASYARPELSDEMTVIASRP